MCRIVYIIRVQGNFRLTLYLTDFLKTPHIISNVDIRSPIRHPTPNTTNAPIMFFIPSCFCSSFLFSCKITEKLVRITSSINDILINDFHFLNSLDINIVLTFQDFNGS